MFKIRYSENTSKYKMWATVFPMICASMFNPLRTTKTKQETIKKGLFEKLFTCILGLNLSEENLLSHLYFNKTKQVKQYLMYLDYPAQ